MVLNFLILVSKRYWKRMENDFLKCVGTLSIMNNFTIVQGWRKILKDNKMFFKNQAHNQFWQQIQGKPLALKDVWQP